VVKQMLFVYMGSVGNSCGRCEINICVCQVRGPIEGAHLQSARPSNLVSSTPSGSRSNATAFCLLFGGWMATGSKGAYRCLPNSYAELFFTTWCGSICYITAMSATRRFVQAVLPVFGSPQHTLVSIISPHHHATCKEVRSLSNARQRSQVPNYMAKNLMRSHEVWVF
jgi:hypothetical protein